MADYILIGKLKMKTKIIIYSSIIVVLFNLSCHNNPVAPEEPGRRDYTWTADTLQPPYAAFSFYPTRMWGSSESDIWLGGTGGLSLLWHFDGSQWNHIAAYDGQTSPSAMWGFSSSNIWLGSTNEFWRYDGSKWYKYSNITPPAGYDVTSIEDIWGSNYYDVWRVGFADQFNGDEYKGVIMHYTGSQWQFMPIPDMRIHFISIREQYSTNQLFLEGWEPEQTAPDTFKVYLYDRGEKLKEIYSGLYEMALTEINGQVFFVSQGKIYKILNNKLNLWKDFSEIASGYRITGRSEIDFFLESLDNGGIFHYNGTDLTQVFPINTTDYPIVRFIFEKDIFFVCQNLYTNLITIVHGKLP